MLCASCDPTITGMDDTCFLVASKNGEADEKNDSEKTGSPKARAKSDTLSAAAIGRLTAPPKGEAWLWSSRLRGFGVRATPPTKKSPAGRKSYVIQYRPKGSKQTRRLTLGSTEALTLPQAREMAAAHLLSVAQGADPSADRARRRKAPTVSELAIDYLDHAQGHLKPSSLGAAKRIIERWILPRWGARAVESIVQRDIEELLRDLRDQKSLANKVRSTVSAMWTKALDWNVATENPTKRVARRKENVVHRPLGELELRRLGAVMIEARAAWVEKTTNPEASAEARELAENPKALDIVALLLLTGARRSEIENLRWSEVKLDDSALNLSDSKTGAKTVWLSEPAKAIVARQRREALSPYVFPSIRTKGAWSGTTKAWLRLRKRAQIEDVRLHDLRHTTGSTGAALGLSQHQIAKVLTHTGTRNTDRYSAPRDEVALAAAQRIGEAHAGALGLATDQPDSEGTND